MEFLKSRRVIIVAGVTAALLAGVGLAAFFISREPAPTDEAPPASQGGLVVETGRDDDVKLDERRPLHCFVGGKLVGDLTVADCAKRNGVATGALDVGLDKNGALAGAVGADPDITPLNPDAASASAPIEENAAAQATTGGALAAGAKVASCSRRDGATWSRLPDDDSLENCVELLFGGLCDRTAAPIYGRWGDQTLRLSAGRIETSPDGRNYHLLNPGTPGCGPG